ncbi:MAG: YlxR family protein [Propionibacteriaceae bacterium]|nr:YlxR family protein [Propionibacteriaceae bacterium]
MSWEPTRTCVGCRVRAPQSALLRLVWDGNAVRFSRTAPGRGAWLHPSEDCREKAAGRGRLAHALRQPGCLPPPDFPS